MSGISKKAIEQLLDIIKIAYPNSKIDFKNDTYRNLWHDNLKDLEAGKLALALKAVIATHEFPPTIATLRIKYAEINMPIKVDNEEGWGLVMRAVRNYGYMRAEEAMDSLPAQVQKAVQYIGGFQAVCETEKLDVARGQFAKAMASANERTKSDTALGIGLTEQIHKFNLMAEKDQRLKLEYNSLDEQRELSEEWYKKTNEENIECIQSVKDILNQCIGGDTR